MSRTLATHRPVVAESWRRCADAGARVDSRHLPPIRLAPDELRDYRARHPLAHLLPMITDLLGESAGDEHVFAVTDNVGTLLWVRGDPGVQRRVERMHFVEGAGWAESQAGTNAPGTALAIGAPVQICAGEHYNSAVRPWSCAAAPVRDPDSGQVLGALDLTGGADIAGPQSLALVRATARAVEGELARLVAAADERARLAYADRCPPPGTQAVLLSPGGRLLAGPPGLVAAGSGALASGRPVAVERIGTEGHLVVSFVDGVAQRQAPALWLAALGRDAALLQVEGRTLRLRPRHSEILVVLALADRGLSGGRLAVEVAEEDLARVTLRAEISRLRTIIGDLLASQPYRLCHPVRSDFGTVQELLTEGRVAEAYAAYPGPLLPSSTAPAVVAARTHLERHLRGAVLASTEPALLRSWVGTPWGIDDPQAWRRLADLSPGGSAQRATAAARARDLLADATGWQPLPA